MAEGICRICLQRSNITKPMLRKQNGVSPLEKLMKCKLKTDLYNSETAVICFNCNVELDTVVKFLEKCSESYEVLVLKCKLAIDSRSSFTIEHLSYFGCEVDSNTHNDGCEDLDNVEIHNNHAVASVSAPTIKVEKAANYTCLQCGKVFNMKPELITHMKIHNNRVIEPYGRKGRQIACPMFGCGKTFSTTTNLNTHIRSHNGEKPYECAECGKKFISKNTLRNHLKIHAGIKPYLCSICGATFTNNKMTEHMLTHTTDKPYTCDVPGCKKRFKSKLALKIHASTTHRSDAVCCSLCPSKYKHAQSLRKHLRKKHGLKMQDKSERNVNYGTETC